MSRFALCFYLALLLQQHISCKPQTGNGNFPPGAPEDVQQQIESALKASKENKDTPVKASLDDLVPHVNANKDSNAISKDAISSNDIDDVLSEIEDTEKVAKKSLSDDTYKSEMDEAIATGTFKSSDDVSYKSERDEAIATGTYDAAEDDVSNESERDEAIATGTYDAAEAEENESDEEWKDSISLEHMVSNTAESDQEDKRKEKKKGTNSSWLPPKTSITEEIDAINTNDGAKGLVDGDIMPPPLENGNDEHENENEKRNAIRDRRHLWRTRVIPYTFDASLSSRATGVIKAVIAEYENRTCIRFKMVQASSQDHYINFFKGPGCYSYVGKTGGNNQNVSIGSGCEHKGIVIHELMHALGFYHEQSRFDRDQYVRIDFSNIKAGREGNFKKKTIQKVTGLGLPYDYDGIMHYGAYAFARDRSKPTIVKLKNTGGPIGQRTGFSATDLTQLNTLYDCKTSSVANSWSSWSAYSQCIDLGDGQGSKEHSQRFCFKKDLSLCAGANRYGTQSRSRACGSGPTHPPPKTTRRPAVSPTSGGNGGINEAICGTRAHGLAHPALNPQQIVGGSNARPGDWPWQVGFARAGSTFVYCGGTLVSDEWIISAAHCFQRGGSPSRITARLGDHNRLSNEGTEQVIALARIIVHPGYNKRTLDKDIALLKLSRKVKFTKYIRPACVPSAAAVIKDGADAFVSGWGKTTEGGSTSPILQVARVPIVSEATCKKTVNGLTDAMICAGYAQGGIDSCQGDSGGPLVLKHTNGKYYLGGVVSWGIGCARRGQYGVYARVTALRSWLDTYLLPAVPTIKPTTEPGPVISQPDLRYCNFDENSCGLYDNDLLNANWMRVATKLGMKDHTTETGSFMALTPAAGSAQTNAGLSSTLLAAHATSKCLELFYNMTGPSSKNLTISVSTDFADKTILSLTQSKGSYWNIASVTIAPRGLPYSIDITGSIIGSQSGDMVAIDDIVLMDGACPTSVPSPSVLTCAFGAGLCNWKQAQDDNFDWSRRKGRTPSSRTGPSQGVNGPNDYYIFIETSYPRRTGQIATIRSPSVTTNIPMCLSLKTHMYGRYINTLKVFRISGGSGKETELFKKTGNQGNKWNRINVDLPVGGPYQIAISGIRGNSYTGDIAIDELQVRPFRCDGVNGKPPTARPIVQTKPPPSASALLDCAFQTSMCNWTQAKDDKFDWTRRKGSTPSSSTGPSNGPNGPNDYYIYIETSYPRRSGDVAKILSPSISPKSAMCLSMKAHMYGGDINTLKVFKISSSGAGTELFKKIGDQGNKWFDVKIDLPAGGSYQIEINAIRGPSYRGDIAVDDLKVLPNQCGGGATTKPPVTSPVTQPAGGCGVSDVPLQRVISGKNAARGSWPWQILMIYGSRPICGGTLINPTTVVTAAHCVSGRESQASSFKVRVGEHDTRGTEGSEVDIPVSRIISHPSYSRRTIDFDVAVMKLARPATLGKFVKTACLPAAGQAPAAGSTCYITGFGKIKHPGNMHHTLQQASLKVVTQNECTRVNTAKLGIKITSRMICAGNGAGTTQSGCHGDSGGPFVCNSGGRWYLQGAVSWGSGRCSASAGYTVFAKTSEANINAWIRNLA